MRKIVIIGGGFSGISAVSGLSRFQKRLDLEVTLIDKKREASFLPVLPDCLGRNVKPAHLLYDLAGLSGKKHFNFIQDEVLAVDLEKKEVKTSTLSLAYDFLIIASGTETNFYGDNEVRKRSFKLDDARDASVISEALAKNEYDSYFVAGGGYTGVEVATNLRVYLEKNKINKKITIIERAPSILGPLPQWMKDYVSDNLKRLKIEVLVNSGVDKAGVTGRSMLIWCAGVRTGDFIQELKVEKNPQGRIKVDEYLKVTDSCFAAGDTAYFYHKNNFLRMAVQFAIVEGKICAKNVIRSIEGNRLLKFKPRDLGLIVPMANNRACGTVLGINARCLLAIFFHYLMCIYRSLGFKNKFGIIKDLLTENA